MPGFLDRKASRFSRTPATAVLLFLLIAGVPLSAQTFTVLYSFTGGTDGGNPYGGVALDGKANVYGTASQGGSPSGGCPMGCGVVFKLDASGHETVIHNFGAKIVDGQTPLFSDLIRDSAGNLYGTTSRGGAKGFGTIFVLNPAGKETVLSFPGGAAGGFPEGGPTIDKAGNVYATTYYRGSGCPLYGCGTVLEITKSGKGRVLHSFSGGDGNHPVGSVAVDSQGTVYGTTIEGGSSDAGVVYRVDQKGTETVLYAFRGQEDGGFPHAGPIVDDAGNVYMTDWDGYGAGAIFEIDPLGNVEDLHAFCVNDDCLDGGDPWGTLLRDEAGNLYGTTEGGGGFLAGVVFKLDPNGVLTVLHAFNVSTDGGYPTGALVRDTAGNFYGTTISGGAHGFGTLYKLSPN